MRFDRVIALWNTLKEKLDTEIAQKFQDEDQESIELTTIRELRTLSFNLLEQLNKEDEDKFSGLLEFTEMIYGLCDGTLRKKKEENETQISIQIYRLYTQIEFIDDFDSFQGIKKDNEQEDLTYSTYNDKKKTKKS